MPKSTNPNCHKHPKYPKRVVGKLFKNSHVKNRFFLPIKQVPMQEKLMQLEIDGFGRVVLVLFILFFLIKKEPKKSRLRLFLFFCLETKEPKVQDLDLFAKKLQLFPRKSPELGRKDNGIFCM